MADLIDRQAAIEVIEKQKSLVERPITETRWFDLGLGKAQDVISELPSVQPEQKEGHWIKWWETKTDEYGEIYIPHWKCSECGKEYAPYSASTVIYCMRCGVKIGGDAE